MSIKLDNLIVISASNSMGGAEQCLQLIAETANSQHIFLKKSTSSSLFLKDDAKVKFLTSKPLIIGFILLARALYNYRKGHIILSSHAYLNACLGVLKRIGYLKSDVIVRESTSLFTRFTGIKKASYKLAYLLGYPSVKMVICQTELMKAQLLNHNKFLNADQVITLPNPINLANVYEKANEYSVNISTDFICAAGRLITIKGFELLIKAFKEIIPEHQNLKLVILGAGTAKENLLLLINNLKLEDKVLLIGHVDNPYPYFKQAKLCVVSSIKEGFPNVLLQMLALNTSVVSTLCAGGIEDIPGIIKVDPDNVNELARGINTALNTDTRSIREELDAYLSVRSPEMFLQSVINKLQVE